VDREKYGSYEEALGNVIDGVPLGCVGDPAAFGDVVAVLASPRASFVTGACVPVDGGRLRR
jgi:3-oxoacyl-[acyl-carrier protein] reductase